MKYMLLLYASESATSNFTPEDYEQIGPEKWFALMGEMKAAGVLLDNNGLAPIATATTVRVREGKTLTIDGPFAETHEQFGGYFLLECKDLDDAIGWAAKVPHALYGSVEVRPLWSEQA